MFFSVPVCFLFFSTLAFGRHGSKRKKNKRKPLRWHERQKGVRVRWKTPETTAKTKKRKEEGGGKEEDAELLINTCKNAS